MSYDEFIAAKIKRHPAVGFEPLPIRAALFDWQKAVVRWAVLIARACLAAMGPPSAAKYRKS